MLVGGVTGPNRGEALMQLQSEIIVLDLYAELIRSFVKMSGRRELVPSLVRHAMPPLQEIPNN